MGGKWLEILKEVAPQIRRVAMLYNPQSAAQGAGSGIYLRSFETVASALAVHSAALPVRDAAEMERSLAAFSAELNGGLLVPPDIFNTTHREQIVSLAARHRLPGGLPLPLLRHGRRAHLSMGSSCWSCGAAPPNMSTAS